MADRQALVAKLKAAAWAAAAELGHGEALRLLAEVQRELGDSQWSGGGHGGQR